ncbi:hypothetical protein PIB30_098165, partial [Stylosanthes scabra]|nr:hypothetical protein [Stylosanthes scabra]
MLDDTTEKCCSFSNARILIDSYEWESIKERIELKVSNMQFEVYVKEIGWEIFSTQSHPLWCPVSLAVGDDPTHKECLDYGGEMKVPETPMEAHSLEEVEENPTMPLEKEGDKIEWWDPLINDELFENKDGAANYVSWGGNFEFSEEILMISVSMGIEHRDKGGKVYGSLEETTAALPPHANADAASAGSEDDVAVVARGSVRVSLSLTVTASLPSRLPTAPSPPPTSTHRPTAYHRPLNHRRSSGHCRRPRPPFTDPRSSVSTSAVIAGVCCSRVVDTVVHRLREARGKKSVKKSVVASKAK